LRTDQRSTRAIATKGRQWFKGLGRAALRCAGLRSARRMRTTRRVVQGCSRRLEYDTNQASPRSELNSILSGARLSCDAAITVAALGRGPHSPLEVLLVLLPVFCGQPSLRS
jgi:hypothetical protein